MHTLFTTLLANAESWSNNRSVAGGEGMLKDLHNIEARTRPQESSHMHSLLTEMQEEVGAVTELVVTTTNELVAISYQDAPGPDTVSRAAATYKLNDM